MERVHATGAGRVLGTVPQRFYYTFTYKISAEKVFQRTKLSAKTQNFSEFFIRCIF